MRAVVAKLYQRVSNFTIALILAVSSVTAMAPFIFSQKADATAPHFEDFSSGVGDWLTAPQITASGGVGVVSNGGSPHTKFGGYEATWTSDYTASIDVYLDPSWAAGEGFNYSVASNNNSGTHLRDFIFHVGVVEDYGSIVGKKLLVNGSNNSDSWANPYKLVNENAGNYYEVTEAGWYTLQHQFQNVGGVLSVNLNLLQSGTQLWSVTRTNPADTIPTAVGGHRYGWFTFNSVVSGLSIDNVSLVANVPDAQRPQLSNISITPTINGNIGGVVTVYFDLEDETGVDLTRTRVLFADGPNTTNASKESAKFAPVHISGNSYKAEINTLNFVKANWTGQYNLTFNLYDILGNHGSSKPADFRGILIDNSGPTSTLQSPTSGAIINGVQRFTFDVTDHTGVASGYMKFQENSTQYPLTNGGSGEWYADVDTSLLTDGDYTIDARFVDSFGKARYGSNKGTVTIDSLAPHVEITNPTGTLYNTDVEVRGTVDDLHPRHYWVNVTRNGSTVFNQTVLATSFTDQLLYTATQEGDYVVTLAARDAAGGTATSGNRSADVTRSFTIDKTVQAPTLVSPADGVIMQGASVTQEWSTTDSDIDYYIYESYNDALATSLRWHEQFSSTSKTATNVAEAEYWWRVKAVDNAGNVSDWSDLWKITIDNTAPTIPVITTPFDGQYFNSSPISNQWASSSDAISGVLGYQIAYQYDDGHTFGASTCAGETAATLGIGVTGKFIGCRDVASTQRNHAPGSGEQGGVTIWVRAQDNAGNWSDWSSSVHYFFDATDPVITLNGDATVTVEAGDTYTEDGATALDVIDGDLTGSIITTGIVDTNTVGVYTVTYTVSDSAGNTSTANRTVNVVDTTAPVVTINALITTDTTPTLTGSVDDTNATVVVTIGSVDYTATNNGDGTWTVTIPALALGTYTATVTATDAATNVGTATADVTVEQVVVQENNPDTDEDDETAPQTIVTPTPDPDVLGEQDDQEQAADDADNSDQGVAAAQDENSEDSSNDGTIAGLAWYWWLLILAAVAGFIWWLIGALRRRSAES